MAAPTFSLCGSAFHLFHPRSSALVRGPTSRSAGVGVAAAASLRRTCVRRIIHAVDRSITRSRSELAVNQQAKQAFIQRIARENRHDAEGRRILWSRHAIAELANEGWNRSIVEVGLEKGEVIED